MNPIRSTHQTEAKLVAMHQAYCSLTGRDEAFMEFTRDWWEFAQRYDQMTLENVLRYIIKVNGTLEKRRRISLALRNILDLQNFETRRADWALEQKELATRKRAWQPTQGERELAAMRHEEVKPPQTDMKKVDIALVISAMRRSVEDS